MRIPPQKNPASETWLKKKNPVSDDTPKKILEEEATCIAFKVIKSTG